MFRELAAGVIACVQMAYAQPAEVTPLPTIPFIVAGFDRFQLVAVSEMHGSRETVALLAAVIRQPGFAGQVTDIVVEFGNARYQSLMDRYIAGENVRDSDLRQAWENTTLTSTALRTEGQSWFQ